MQRLYFTDFASITNSALKILQRQYVNNPLSLLDMSKAEANRVTKKITKFYRDHLRSSKHDGYVVGLSGGIDSTLVAYLTTLAVGSQNVMGVLMPSHFTNSEDIADALNVVTQLGIRCNNYLTIEQNFDPVTQLIEQMGEQHPVKHVQRVKSGNIHARVRMIILRDIARRHNFLVAGTSNASERFTGYATLAGDGLGGVDNEGLDQLFKTSERILATFLGLPQSVIDKPPSAGLWKGQTDEAELGVRYDQLDQILVGYLLRLKPSVIVRSMKDKEINVKKVKEVFERVKRNAYKSQMPPGAKLF